MTQFRKSLFIVAAFSVFASCAAAQSTAGAAFDFKLVNSPPVQRLLPVRIVVPDHHSPRGLRFVSENDTFFSFERFRIELNLKRSGYVYILVRTNDGDVEQLYPRSDDGDNYFHRNTDAALPFNGWFRFDRHAGQEELYIIQSADSLEEDDCADILESYEDSPDTRIDGVLIRRMFLDHQVPE